MQIAPFDAAHAHARAADATDPSLLRKHSTFRAYRTAAATYPRIRTFYHDHPHADKLPSTPAPLPLLVFVHGLGGSLAQFGSLLTTLANTGPCFGIDLPGCGRSAFAPVDWPAYSHRALVQLLSVAVQQACDAAGTRQVVLVGHSLGCALAASLAAPASSVPTNHTFEVLGIVAICPLAGPLPPPQARALRRLLRVPTPLFDLWRRWDRRGGIESPSVRRFVGPGADDETKRLQRRYNEQSRTAVWRRVAWGALVEPGGGDARVAFPDPTVWASLRVPLLLVAGAADPVTPAAELSRISKALSAQGFVRYHEAPRSAKAGAPRPEDAGASGAPASVDEGTYGAGATMEAKRVVENDALSGGDDDGAAAANPRLILKTYVLPRPASHALLYARGTYRTLSGLLQPFLADHVDERLSLGWQLQYLKDANKWDVKNLRKWQGVAPVSAPVGGLLRALKTLRDGDDVHAPRLFVDRWKGEIKAVIDISHESPVYDPRELEAGGIEYHKFPTVSKLPPTPTEVDEFTALVDRLRGGAGAGAGARAPDGTAAGAEDRRVIGVHCHYGFNRTGFFICAYLIQREGYGVQQALDEFQRRRAPGIRHEHFIDTLFVRYCAGLQRPSITQE